MHMYYMGLERYLIVPSPKCINSYPHYISQVSPAQPTGGRRRRASEMDPDERRQRFLERNRAAASRCRQKRKLWVNSLEKKAEDLASMNVSLTVSLSLQDYFKSLRAFAEKSKDRLGIFFCF